MEYEGKLGLATQQVEPRLEQVLNRINAARDRMADSADTLCKHSDQLFGPVPECGEKNGIGMDECGMMDALRSALDRLEDQATRVAIETDRACKLV